MPSGESIIPRKIGDPGLPGAGRPKGSKSKKNELRKILDFEIERKNPLNPGKKTPKEKRTVAEFIHLAIVAQAIKGSVKAAKLVYEYTLVKPTQNVNIEADINFETMSLKKLNELRKNGLSE